MRIVLTRHGEVEGIVPPRFRGRTQLALTRLGQQQALALAAAVASQFSPAMVYTSPMQRCRDTGHSIATACGVGEQVLEGINDFDYGDWQWKTHDEARAEYPAQLGLWKSAPHWMHFPGGESLQAVALRTMDALRELLATYEKDTIVLVAHDSVNRVILLHALDLPLSAYWRIEQDPCCLNVVDLRADGRATIKVINETAHLHAAGSQDNHGAHANAP
ncbi:histidine phosphatase family protein [Paraburkholderia tropica]|uniref:histidine phosphatase family protein n=1 Tax=Paraburkholderia tropica TaxID=92647 RepID=UPI002AB78E7A|nr:histidine phosphatase family protein [Paraburkholderia tropica]